MRLFTQNKIAEKVEGPKYRVAFSSIVLSVLLITAITVFGFHKKVVNITTLAQNQQNVAVPAVAVDPKVNTVISTQIAQAQPIVVTLLRKDNLAKVFKRNGLDPKQATTILALDRNTRLLRHVRPGEKITLQLDNNKHLQQLSYALNVTTTLTVTNNNGLHSQLTHVDPVAHLEFASATIHGSIYTAGKRAGIPNKIMAQLVKVFNNKINVARSLRNGDRLAVSYKVYAVNGKKIRDGEIVAAKLIHKDQVYRILGFTDANGVTDFYTPDGMNLKSPFVRAPVRYTRIGSRFSYARMHPILGIVRAHPGVDFVAPYGTPIKATSNGKVAFAGREGGYGNVVIIEHGQYSTLCAHMSRFASNVSTGRYVKQGQVIGYVGATGLATGPHVHYEFRIAGVHYDPLRVKFPQGEMIAREYRSKFFAFARTQLAQLDMHCETKLAMNPVK